MAFKNIIWKVKLVLWYFLAVSEAPRRTQHPLNSIRIVITLFPLIV